jgi:hypothetical protein
MKSTRPSNRESLVVLSLVDDFSSGNGILDEKCYSGLKVAKIDRIYSNDSNIETVEESNHEPHDALHQINAQSLL